MIRIALSLLFCCLAFTLGAADARWYYDLSEAKAAAKKEKKLVLMNFTGSDWCGWCMKLKAQVFSTAEFNDYARTNLVLLEIDLPNGKPLSLEQLMTNERLKEEYHVQGFPTFIVLNTEGQEIWRLPTYVPNPPGDWIRTMEALKVRAGLASPFPSTPAATSSQTPANAQSAATATPNKS